jgi:subtilisin family serine protease
MNGEPSEALRLPDDDRTRSQYARDHEQAEIQVHQVNARWNDVELWSELAARVIAARRTRNEEGARYDLFERLDRSDDPILVVAGEMLVRADELTPEERRRLEELGAMSIRNLGDRVLRVPVESRSAAARKRLGAPMAPAPRSGVTRGRVRVKEHYVTPMGPVMKAMCGPEPATGLGPAPVLASQGAAGMKVAVVDTGIARARRTDGWLASVPITRTNFDRLDDFPPKGLDFGAGHGTFAAGVIQQLAPNAQIRVYRGLDSDGFGSEAMVATAMVQAARDGAQVINLSLGLETDDHEPPIALEAAVEIISERWPKVLLVAAAGNFGHDTPCWPAAFKGVTAVAGLDRTLKPAVWSSFGSWVDCSTIGEAVLSTYVEGVEEAPDDPDDPNDQPDQYPESAWAIWSGTSFAAPQVTGAVAQIAHARGIAPRDALALLLFGLPAVPGFGRRIQILPPR